MKNTQQLKMIHQQPRTILNKVRKTTHNNKNPNNYSDNDNRSQNLKNHSI